MGVQQKSCRIQFFATKEVEKLPVKKIFPYEENKQRVKNHEAESLFYQAWRDIKVEAESEIKMNREAPKVKKTKWREKRREKSPETNWETTTFNKSEADSSSEVVQRKKVKKKKCSKRKTKDEDSSESNYSAIVHFTRDSEMDKPCVSGYEEKRNYEENREKIHHRAGHHEKRGKERSGKKKAGSSSRKHCHHGKSSKKRHH